MKIANLIQNIEKYILFIGVSLFAVFVFPRFPSPYIVPKEIFTAVIISLVLILCSVRSIIKGESPLYIGKFDLGIILFALVYILAAVFMTPNKMETLFYPGTVTFIILGTLFYFLINQLDKKAKDLMLVAVFTSGIFLSISILFTELGLFAKIPFLPSFIKDSGFNALGGWLPAAIYLTALLPIGINFIIKDKDIIKRVFWVVASAVIAFGLAVAVITILPGKAQSPVLPNVQTSWEVAVETLKVSPILGIGAGNYLTAFNLYKPVSYNMTNLWQIRFSSADNFYFTLITELGFAGLAALVILMIQIYGKFKTDLRQKSWEEISVAILFILFLVFPSASTLIFLLMMLLAIFSGSEEKKITLATNRVPSAIITVPVFLAIAALGFFGTKAVVAEVTYEKSLVALSNNDAKGTYELMTKAETENPYVDRYHASLAQVDMALATAIASNKNLTDTDRSTITQLIQQAINEGKANVTLNPYRSGNWESLGQIYRSIMSFAQGADQFTIQAFTEAIALDPTNPNLRIELGGVYYALGRYSDAIDSFKLATLAKNNLANAYYNLAIAYRENKDYDNAITAMNTVLTLVDKNSSDYTLAKKTLDDLQKNKSSSAKATEGQALTTPTPVTTTVKPPITLPSEATPPATSQ